MLTKTRTTTVVDTVHDQDQQVNTMIKSEARACKHNGVTPIKETDTCD